MKQITLLITGLFLSSVVFGQVSLTDTELEVFKMISSQYGQGRKDFNLKKYKKEIPERFHGYIDQMIGLKGKSKTFLKLEYLRKPTQEELLFWYITTELYYNSQDSIPVEEAILIQNYLQDTTDSRWLLQRYYGIYRGNMGQFFNDGDLSKKSYQLFELGFENKTEEAVFFFFIINHIEPRLRVLTFTGNGDPMRFIKKLPQINGKPYFYYTDFDFPDFDWYGYGKIQSYKEYHLNLYYAVLMTHLSQLVKKKDILTARELYQNSILSEPKYFQYSIYEDDLKALYEQGKN